MLKGKINLLKKELNLLNIKKEKRVFLAFINKVEDKVVVQHNRNTVFVGSHLEFTELFLNESSNNSIFNPEDIVVSMDWRIRPNVFNPA